MEISQDIKFIYRFDFGEGQVEEFEIALDRETLNLREFSEEKPPGWAMLDQGKCSHCPLNSKTSPYCPIARNIASVVDRYANFRSFTKVITEVETADRSYKKAVTLQEAMYSIFGLIMATSGCPHMDHLKPMARFHLPFASYEETIVRWASFYLLREFFVYKRGGTPDFHMENMEKTFEKVKLVDDGFVQRIRQIGKGDAGANSITILHGFAQLLGFEISSNFSDLERYFFPKS